ncbi:A24 family peptidase [Nocardioides sp. C4-1]|uniref:A24 family peptidase n=1 Tax=Nocardioides sp. C4-1 TaxID=3151851 RepID=UPI0032666F65
MSGDVVLVAALAAIAAGLAGLFVPRAIAALREPPPDPVLAELEAKALEGPLTPRQQVRLDEGPKRLYRDIGAEPGLAAITSVVAALVAVAIVLAVGVDPDLVVLLPVVPIGVLLAVVDLRTRLLPSRVVWAGLGLALVCAAALVPFTDTAGADLVRALIGFVLGFGFFFVLWFVYPAGMGFGDVRLAGLCGFLLAHQGWGEWVVGLYSAFLLSGVPALVVALLRRSTTVLKFNIPLGPFLLVGVPIGLAVGAWVGQRLVGG